MANGLSQTFSEYVDVINPATGAVIARTPLCGRAADVDAAAKAAADALPGLAADSGAGAGAVPVQTARSCSKPTTG